MSQLPLAGHYALLFALPFFAPAALAQPGALDPTFGGDDGFVLTDFGYEDTGGPVLLQPDGRIVVVGSSDGDLMLARYFADGAPDPAFGDGGLVVTDFGDGDENRAGGSAAALLPDNRILVLGMQGWFFAEHRAFLARYLPDGAPDPTFGEGGVVLLDTARVESASAMAVLPDGKILLGGYVDDLAVLVRYLPDGTPDASFGEGGTVEVGPFGVGGLAVLPNGRIVLGGKAGWWYESQIGALRLLPDGTPDTSFGENGLAAVTLGRETFGVGAALQPDGGVVVLVHYQYVWVPGDPPPHLDRGYGLVRFGPDGAPDPTFGGGDGVTEIVAGLNTPASVVLQPDGKLVVAGLYQDGEASHPVLARHHADGALDAGFGDGGLVHGVFGGTHAGFWGAALQPDGRVLAAGFSGNGLFGAGGQYDLLLARYLGDAAVAVSAAPEAAPVVIPPEGGPFTFTLRLANATDQPQTVEVWTEADGPTSMSPVLGPKTVTLPPGALVTRTVTQRVPGAAPPGDYTYTVHAGAFPGGAVTSASFPLTKEAGARADGEASWTATGWDDAPASTASEAPAALALSAPSPNPFREGARITLSVPAPQPVRVAVYDALGREVAVLLDGAAEAGAHALALDGQGLAAGVYVVRAEGAQGAAARRVVRY